MITKQTIKQLPFIGNIAKTIYTRLKGTWHLNPSHWIRRVCHHTQGIAVQIGSNDGQTGDPLHAWLKHKKGWSAVFVEPVPFIFNRLKKNYSGQERFAFENAVVNDGSTVEFYWLSERARSALPSLPSWYDQLGGFSREHIVTHLPQTEPFIEQATLPGITLMNLFEKHRLKKIDLLHIDTEGADFQILRQLDLERYRPRVILYERRHLSPSESESSIRFLQAHYALFDLGADILAIEKTTHNEMLATLKPLASVRVVERPHDAGT